MTLFIRIALERVTGDMNATFHRYGMIIFFAYRAKAEPALLAKSGTNNGFEQNVYSVCRVCESSHD